VGDVYLCIATSMLFSLLLRNKKHNQLQQIEIFVGLQLNLFIYNYLNLSANKRLGLHLRFGYGIQL
jgi:hypothetical protein